MARRDHSGNFTRPLYETETSRIEITIEIQVDGFFQRLHAVAVKVVDRCTLGRLVLVYQGEGGAVDDVHHTQCPTELFDQRRLAPSHRRHEQEDLRLPSKLQKRLSGLGQSCLLAE